MFGRKRNKRGETQKQGDGPAKPTRQRFDVESLEKRVLMSASWVDADTGDSQSGATGNNDQFNGSEATDIASGKGGQDLLFGNGGDDILSGGSGDDRLEGGAGDDTLQGGSGQDTLIGGSDNDTIEGGSGDDAVEYTIGDGVDRVDGGSGSDAILIRGVSDSPSQVLVESGSNFESRTGGDADGFDVVVSVDGEAAIYAKSIESISFVAANDGDSFATSGDLAETSLSSVTWTPADGGEHPVFTDDGGDSSRDSSTDSSDDSSDDGSSDASTDGSAPASAGNLTPQDLTMSSQTVPYGAAGGEVVGTLSAADSADATLSYTLVDDAGGRFEIDGSSGEITVADGATIDAASDEPYAVHVKVTDEHGASAERLFTIEVAPVVNTEPDAGDDGPGAAGGVLVSESFDDGVDGWGGQASAAGDRLFLDQDQTATKTFDFGTEHAGQTVIIEFDTKTDGGWESSGKWQDYFNVSLNGTEVASDSFRGQGQTESYRFEAELDAEGRVEVSLNVDSTAGDEEIFVDNFTITSGDNWSDAFRTSEDTPLTIDAAKLLENDGDGDGDALSIASVQDAVNGSVTLNGDGSITFTPDPDTNGTASFSYTVDDGNGGTDTATVSIEVAAADDAPNSLGFTGGEVSEDAPAGTLVATASATDPDAGDTLSYSLSDDAGGKFAIDASTGEIVTTGAMDHEDAASHTVTVRAVDADGLSIERELTVTVGDVNESPAGLGFVGGSVSENAPAGTAVATASAT
ncbi:MAG: cadherin-like domain-containing protein, partial [Planctomycetota bacterium]